MDCGRRNTEKYSFRCPDLKELRKLASFVLDTLDFKHRNGKLLSIMSADVVEGLLSVLVQFYDPLYRCFTFPDFLLVPTVEEYSHLLGILVLVEYLLMDWRRFTDLEATDFAQDGSMNAFQAIFVLLIYGLALFPNIDSFVDVNAIRIFLIGNHVPTSLGDMYFSLNLRNSKGGGTIVCCIPLMYKSFILHFPQTPTFVENKQCLWWSQRLMSLTNDDIVWYDSSLGSMEIIDSCGEFSNVSLIGTQGGINYNPALARRQLGFPLRDKPNNTLLEGLFYQEGKDTQHLKQKIVHAWHNVHRKGRSELGPYNCVALEAYTLWVKKRALELKIPYPCERPMFMVVVEPLTLPNQYIEELEDALTKMKQEKDIWEERFCALSKEHEELQLESKDKDVIMSYLKTE
ncbi:hypothetical protein KIW84_023591 [Lathyrus oleraceus]|uniref:DUF7745 domain-containing protein n=1 Tax=Pisum sativum TaxID=3888 RepID=A0A9D5BC60_PEA|nr:hypothetical protein KIW84_023591 [Pisum sativum]